MPRGSGGPTIPGQVALLAAAGRATIKNLSAFYTAAGHGTLPAVSWIAPTQANSDHPPANLATGQAYLTNLINTIMRGPDWDSTAIFLARDDWGGCYDQVVPPAVDQNGYGLRVPALVISPYAKTGFVDHQTLSFDASNKFIEDDFLGGARLDPATDGRPDPRPDVREDVGILGDLASDLDFSQPPRPAVLLPTHPASGPASTPLVTAEPAGRHHGLHEANLVRRRAMTAATVPGCPVDESFDPLSPEFLADPYAVMARLPAGRAPVFFAPSIGYYVVTSYDAVEQVFRDPATYSAAVAQAPLAPIVPEAQQILLAGGHKPQPSMVSLDEPEHARLRKPAARAFSMKRVTAMIPAIEATTARLLDAVGDPPEFDLVAALAFPLPANIVFSLIGVPAEDYARLKQWDETAFDRPDEFDMHRTDAERHLAFGKGLHYCLGANLGKLEAQIAVTELARRYPQLRLAPDQCLTFHPNISFRGPQVLTVQTRP